MKSKHESVRGERLFYCFVNFGTSPDARPVVHVLPCALVADVLTESHLKWLETPGKNGRPHKDGPMRRLLPDYARVFGAIDNPYPPGWLDEYRDAWHLLKLEPTAVEQESPT